MSYKHYLELIEVAQEATDENNDLYFGQWINRSDAVGVCGSPLELLLLGA